MHTAKELDQLNREMFMVVLERAIREKVREDSQDSLASMFLRLDVYYETAARRGLLSAFDVYYRDAEAAYVCLE